jgi:hypothetical protein
MKLRITFADGDAVEVDGAVSFTEALSVVNLFLDARNAAMQARIDALTARARHTNDTLEAAVAAADGSVKP